MQQYVAEFVGTMILIIFGDGVVAGVLLRNSKAENSGWIVITFGWAMGVAIAVYTVGRISGGHINPAVTLGLATLELFGLTDVPNFGLVDVVPYIIAQFLGAFVGGVLVWLAYLPHWRHTEDPGLKLGVFCTAPAYRNTTANLITEIIGTAVLLFGVLGIASNAPAIGTSGGVDLSAVFATGIAPLLVGLLVLGIGLSLGGPTGYAINPARDLGPRIAHAVLPIAGKGSNDWEYSWIPVVGPIIGGILGALLFYIFGLGG